MSARCFALHSVCPQLSFLPGTTNSLIQSIHFPFHFQKIERTWHNEVIILRRCASFLNNPCVPKWEWNGYQRTVVTCCEANLCNGSNRLSTLWLNVTLLVSVVVYMLQR